MVVLDTAIVNVALPQMQRALGFSGTGLDWVVNAYALTFGGLMLLGPATMAADCRWPHHSSVNTGWVRASPVRATHGGLRG